MRKYKVLCYWDRSLGPEKLLGRLPQIADVDWHEPDHQHLLDHIGEYDAHLCALQVRFDKAVIARAKRLKFLSTPSTGTDHIDCADLAAAGIELLSNKTEFAMLDQVTATAELAWGLILAAVRKIPWGHNTAMQGIWARERFRGHQIAYKTLGILGVGRLGKMVATYGNAFRMRVLGCDVKTLDVPGVQQVDFDTLLRESDVISIHIHLTEETRNLLSKKEFDKMKDGVVIVNTSRGAIINEADFHAALQSGKVRAAGLDVIEGEWRTDLVNHPLIQYAREHENVVIMPHLGGITWESQLMAFEFTANKLADALERLDRK